MRVKLFTHTDLDGIGCAILAKNEAFGNNVDIEYCNYDDINKKVSDFFFSTDALNYEYIYITDISIQESLADEINTCVNGTTCLPKVLLFDHHPTALSLNKFDWCKVNVEEHGEKTSGTRMFYNYLINENFIDGFSDWTGTLYNFVEIVKKYDTWLWKEKYNDDTPKKWNDLFYIYGRERFIEKVCEKLDNNSLMLDMTDITLLQLNQEKIGRYIETKQTQLIEKDILGYRAGIVFAEQYHSEVGNVLATNNPHLDFIVLINPSYSISYRTVKDVNLGTDIAKIYGGGGHLKSAGSPISSDIKNKIIDMIFCQD